MVEEKNENVIWLFDIGGYTEIDVPVVENSPPASSIHTKDVKAQLNQNAVNKLNDFADEFNSEIEKEIKRVLKSNITVQSEILFRTGSIVLSGTVALISWGGAAVINALQKELESQITTLVKMSVQRVVNKIIRTNMTGALPTLKPVEINVTAHGSNKKISKRFYSVESNDETGNLTRAFQRDSFLLNIPQGTLMVALLFILVLIALVFMFDKYFDVIVKR